MSFFPGCKYQRCITVNEEDLFFNECRFSLRNILPGEGVPGPESCCLQGVFDVIHLVEKIGVRLS